MTVSKYQKAKNDERRSQAINMRVAGLNWQHIAETAGYPSPDAARVDINRALKENLNTTADAVTELRELGIARAEALMSSHWIKATRKHDPDSSRTVLRCLDQLMKLQGTAAPVKTETEITGAGVSMVELLERARSAAIAGGMDPAHADEIIDRYTGEEDPEEDPEEDERVRP